MDEACASARVSQDMKPEAIDTVEQELLQIEGRIKAIEVKLLSIAVAYRELIWYSPLA